MRGEWHLKVKGEVACGRVQHQVQQRQGQLRQARPCRASCAARLFLRKCQTALAHVAAVQKLSDCINSFSKADQVPTLVTETPCNVAHLQSLECM